MKLSTFKTPGGAPLRTYAEVAEGFDTTSQGLTQIRSAFDVPFPEPKLSHGPNYSRGKLAYYDPQDIKRWVHDVKQKFGVTFEQMKSCAKGYKHMRESADSEPSVATKLAKFARELIAHGFEAEVKSSSKPGIINRSTRCIVVKGYGMSDELKLYRPLYRWEEGTGELCDVKHERKFSTVEELVRQLSEFYPKLPKCLEPLPEAA